MKKVITAILILIGIVFVAGCSDRGEPELAIVSTATATLTFTPAPTQTTTPEPTATMATADPCFQQVDFETMSEELTGILVLKDNSFEKEDYYLDWETGELITFQTQRAHPYHYSVSPDGQWLAYYADTDILVVEELFGKFQYTLNMAAISTEWNSLNGWINNETLLVKFYGADQNEMDYLVAINPFTGHIEKKISSDFPNILTGWWQWRRSNFWYSLAFYDFTMRYVVYPADPDDEMDAYHLVLYDTLQEKVIGKSGFLDSTLVTPIWKGDGSGFYYVISGSEPHSDIEKDDWYFMDIGGQINQLTDYQKKYEDVEIFDSKLSPNEKYLFYGIFATDFEGEKHPQIQIVDLETMEIIDTCQHIGPFSSVEWSPDSRFIAYSWELKDKTIQTRIMDIEQHTVSSIEENSYPVLWVEDNN